MTLRMPDLVYAKSDAKVLFNQLAVKIEMDSVSNEQYFQWLDERRGDIGAAVKGAKIVEKEQARVTPPLNTAVYYDTPDLRILPTGSLLRTSCNKITHAFCAFKLAENDHGVRRDHRHVFAGYEKATIQADPTAPEAVAIVKRLLARDDIDHPGKSLEHFHGISGRELSPVLCLDDYRFTFFCWLDGQDALRCSIDRYAVRRLREPREPGVSKHVSEVELAIYPRIAPAVAEDPRVIAAIETLRDSLCQTFGVRVTKDIKYQRSARALRLWPA